MLQPPGHHRRSPYFVSGWLDFAVIGGLSIVVFLLLRLISNGGTRPEVVQAVAVTSIFVNYPHFSATVYRLYQNLDNVRQFPVTAIGVPLLMIAGVAASLWQPEWVAPYFVTLFLIWSPYHYSGQTIGITMLYARRSGFVVGPRQRIALSTFVYSTFILSFVSSRNDQPIIRYGVSIPVIHFPAWFGAILIATMCVGATVFLWFVFIWCRSQRSVPPLIILLPAVAQFVWFMPGRQTAMFYEFVPLFHSLQYLYIAWAMQIGLRLGQPAHGKAAGSVWQETFRWGVRNYIGGMLLFIALPWLLCWIDVPLLTSAGIIIAAVNIHHFFVDGVIWKLRDARETSPLMMSSVDWTPQRAPGMA